MSKQASDSKPQPGCIVEYLQNNQPVIGWVLDVQSTKLRIININQREVKLPLSRVLPWAGPAYGPDRSRQEALELLQAHEAARYKMAESIDPLEIWELAQGEMAIAPGSWFADLIWDSPDADQVAGLGRKLLQTKTHFKFSPPDFEIYPEQKVAKLLADLQATQERERIIGYGQAFLKALWDKYLRGKAVNVELDLDVQDKVRELLLSMLANSDNKESELLWKKMSSGLPDDPHLPLFLAQTWGIVPAHYNYLLDRAQYAWSPDWEQAFGEEIEALKLRVEAERNTLENLDVVSIDSGSTRDMDDAFALDKNGDNFSLSLALACPVFRWEFGSGLDKAVQQRMTSIYLPEGSSHMLPESLGTDFFSLCQETIRPSLIWKVSLDSGGEILDFKPRLAWIRVRANQTYYAVERDLDSIKPDSLYVNALELASLLRQKRIESGAVIIEQPDPRIMLEGEGEQTQVILDQPALCSKAQLIVSEFMILANTLAARWCLEHKVPILFRTQNITLPPESAGIWNKPQDIFRLVKSMGASILQIKPKPHATLGVPAYVPVSSPLRRYVDFMNMAQILAHIERGHPIWSQEELKTMLPALSARADSVTRVQRFRPRYWKFLYFKQQAKKRHWDAVIVEAGPKIVSVSLPLEQVFLKAPRSLFGDKLYLGQKFKLRLGKVDPLAGEMRILEAWEE